MRQVVEASIKRVAKVHDEWFRFVETDELLLALVQVKAAVAVLSLEKMMDASVEINGKEIGVRPLVHETFDKLEGELLKRIGAEVDDNEVVLASFKDDDYGVETSSREYPPIGLQWKGSDALKISIYKEVD